MKRIYVELSMFEFQPESTGPFSFFGFQTLQFSLLYFSVELEKMCGKYLEHH